MNKRVAKKILGGSHVSWPKIQNAKRIIGHVYRKYQGPRLANLLKWEPAKTSENYGQR